MAILSTGITIAFETTGFTGNLKSVAWSEIARSQIDDSTWTTTTKRSFSPPDLSKPGLLGMTIHFDPDQEPPIDGDAERITVRWPNATGGTSQWDGEGFIEEYRAIGEIENLMVAEMSVQFSGEILRSTLQQVQTDGDLLDVTTDEAAAVFAAT